MQNPRGNSIRAPSMRCGLDSATFSTETATVLSSSLTLYWTHTHTHTHKHTTHTISKEIQKGYNLNSEVRHGIKNRERESNHTAHRMQQRQRGRQGLNTRGINRIQVKPMIHTNREIGNR